MPTRLLLLRDNIYQPCLHSHSDFTSLSLDEVAVLIPVGTAIFVELIVLGRTDVAHDAYDLVPLLAFNLLNDPTDRTEVFFFIKWP